MPLRNAKISRATTIQSVAADRISLSDNATPSVEDLQSPTTPSTPLALGALDGQSLSKPATISRVGTTGLREGLARRKYAKYQKSRYDDDETTDEDPQAGLSNGVTPAATPGDLQRAGTALSSKTGKDSRLRRGQDRVKGIIWGKKQRRKKEGQSEVDILWENQRGSFFFGRPYYSSQSLLNFDPPAWTNIFQKPSAVDITNATVPDPSWEWAWKMWYVDMSMDCDEQGWQYSFMFQTRFPWHGTHPWFHSFVRRRRWIRQRLRKHRHLANGQVEGGRTMEDAHKLNADYFTIHPSKTADADSSYPPSTTGPQNLNVINSRIPLEEEGSESVDNIRSLLKRLKEASVDREKIKLVLQFMDEGGQEVHYLADEIPHIMTMFMYQYSQRQLLAAMLRKVDPRSSDHRDEVDTKGKEPASAESDAPTMEPSDDTIDALSEQKTDDLNKAIEAADKQIKDFEYWSDIKGMVQSGQSLTAADEEQGWGKGWDGLDKSGPGSSPPIDGSEKGKSKKQGLYTYS